MKETQRLIGLEDRYSANNYKPLDVEISSAKGVEVKDVEGNRYLDMLAGYGALNQGHLHPHITRALRRQSRRLTLTSRAFRNDQYGAFAQTLSEVSGKEKILPMNTGAEAVETAIKLARRWGYEKKGVEPGKAEIITCEGNFHGRTTTITGISTEADYRKGFGAFTPGFPSIPFGNVEALKEAITPNTVGFLVEPIQAEGGVIVPDEGYLQEAARICKENNVLFIADEVQTGFGRTGKMFATQHEGVNPDILVGGKSMGGGVLPVSAAMADREIMDVITPGSHGSTFGGNPLSAAVGKAAIEVVLKERLPERAAEMGEYFMAKLEDIKADSPNVKEVRGKGMLIGVEVYNPAREVCEKLKDEGILAKDAHEKVVRFTPPLIITKRQIDTALPHIAKALK